MLLTTRTSKSKAIAERIYHEVAMGRLHPNEKLPGVRRLAERFDVGRQVVLSAFQLLEKEGLLELRIGEGTYVRSKLPENMKVAGRLQVGFLSWKQDLSFRFNLKMYQSILQHSRIADCQVKLGIESEEGALRQWSQGERLDALIVTGLVDDELVGILNRLDIPYLVCGNYLLHETCCRLEQHSEELIYRSLKSIFSRTRYKNIGMIGHSLEQVNIRQIKQGIERISREYGLPVKDGYFYLDAGEDGYEGMKHQLSLGRDMPELVFLTANAFSGAARFVFEHRLKRGERPDFIVFEDDYPYPDLLDYVIPQNEDFGIVGLERLMDIYYGRVEYPWVGYLNDETAEGVEK